MKNIEEYGFERSDLVIATAVNSYLKKLTPEAREEALHAIVRKDGEDTKIHGPALADLIESAKAAAITDSEAWQAGEGIYQKTLVFIREQLPIVDGKKYVVSDPKEFLRFIRDWSKQ